MEQNVQGEALSLKLIRDVKQIILKLFMVFLATTQLIGCSKEEDNTVYTIQGRLLDDCNNQPVNNLVLSLYQTTIDGILGGHHGGEILANAETDLNGNFTFQFKDKDGGELQIEYVLPGSYQRIMSKLPTKTNLSGLIVYMNAVFHSNIYLDVKNSYTSNDTLHYTDNNINEHTFIVGPFRSGLLMKLIDHSIPEMYYEGNSYRFQYWINSGKVKKQYYSVIPCDTVDVTVTIE